MDDTVYGFRVVRDCGYGQVWSRLAVDMDDALAEVAHWKREGRTGPGTNPGDYTIQAVVPTWLDGGGVIYNPAQPLTVFNDDGEVSLSPTRGGDDR